MDVVNSKLLLSRVVLLEEVVEGFKMKLEEAVDVVSNTLFFSSIARVK